jgi:IMP dehydrogenase
LIIRSEPGLSFDDVLLVPKGGNLEKRAQADIRTRLVGDIRIPIPILSAPMESVTEHRMATAMRRAGGFGVIHRNLPIERQVQEYVDVEYDVEYGLDIPYPAGAAIGVNEGYERWEHLYGAGARIFVVDIAHAHHRAVSNFINNVPTHLRDGGDNYVIVGNVATAEGAHFLAGLGVDGIKVGIGPGAACTTREVTGFGVPQLTAILDVADALALYGDNKPTLIADGGIKNSGDIVKALAAGADSVMLGRLLAGANESPHPGLYYGMASKRVNNHRAPEGVEGAVPITGPVEDTIKQLAWGIRSGISYGGGKNLEDLQNNAEFILVSSSAAIESGVRV